MKKLVYGIGVLDNDYPVTEHVQYKNSEGKSLSRQTGMCPYYSRWRSILARCYDEKYLKKRPTYRGCTVCDDWLTFSNFKEWMKTQGWEGKHLDKDFIKKGNKIYSPETCVFLSLAFNNFPITCSNVRGDSPLGVTYEKERDKYMAKVTNGENKNMFLGRFTTPFEAHKAWQKGKILVGEKLISRTNDDVVITALQRMIDSIQQDIENKEETVSF